MAWLNPSSGAGSGIRSAVGVKFGTQSYYASDSVHWIPLISESIVETRAAIESSAMRGAVNFQEPKSYGGDLTIAGDLQIEPSPNALGVALMGVFGACSTVSATNYITTSFAMQTDPWSDSLPHPEVTFKMHRAGGGYLNYLRGQVTGLTMDFAYGEMMKATLNTVAMYRAVNTWQAPWYPPQDLDRGFPWTLTMARVGSYDIDRLKTVQVAITKPVEPVMTMRVNSYGTAWALRPSGFTQVRVSGSMLFENSSEYARFRSYTEILSRTLVHSKHRFYVEAENEERNQLLHIEIPALKWDSYAPNIGGPGQIEASFTGRAMYAVNCGGAIHVSLRATHSAFIAPTFGDGTY